MGCTPELDGLDERIAQIRRRDRRFSRNAYYFALDTLDYTMVRLGRSTKLGEERHVGAKELLDGVYEFAVEQFGALANHVFQHWGIRATDDFGEIVFSLIDAGLLSRRPQDSRLDFSDGIDFERAFDERLRERLRSISHSH